MLRKIATAVVGMLLVFTAVASEAQDVNYLEVGLFKYGADSYGISFDAGKADFTTCKLATPSDSAGSACPFDEVMRWGLTFSQLMAEIGTGTGDDWTLIWDEGPAQTIAKIDFGVISVSDWLTLPTITDPEDDDGDVSPNAVIVWEWPESPDLGAVKAGITEGDLDELVPGPVNDACDSGDLPHPPLPTTWDPPPGCLGPGTWTALAVNEDEYLRAVPDGISIIEGSWVLQNDEWLASQSIDYVTFTVPEVVPSMSPTGVALLGGLVLAIALGGLAVQRTRRVG
jgi:hypothetical protein